MSTIMHLDRFFQNAYVTRDLDRAVALITERHGLKDWVFFEPEMDVYTADKGWAPCKVKVGLAWNGNVQVELIEPVRGNVQHYLDVLPADPYDATPRFHHICMRVDDWDATRKLVADNDWPVAYEGGVEGCKFVYIDARDTLGHYVEYMWMSPEMWAGSGGQ